MHKGMRKGDVSQRLYEKPELGWTGTFMKQGIALYLLYLHEGKWNGKGIAVMAETAKSAMRFFAEEYKEGACGIPQSFGIVGNVYNSVPVP